MGISKQEILKNNRTLLAAEGAKLEVKPKIISFIQSQLRNYSALKGQAKLNQLILEQINKLQNFAAEQLADFATQYGVSDIETGTPKVTFPLPDTPIEELNLPEIPPEAGIDTKKLTLNPITLPVAELGKTTDKVQGQFTEQVLPYGYDTLPDNLKEEATAKAKDLAKQLALDYIQANKPPFCLPPDTAKALKKKLNNLLEVVETTATALNFASIGLNIVTQVIDGTILLIQGLNIAKLAANQAAKPIPLLPGIVVSLLTDLDDALEVVKETATGDPKIEKVKDQLQTGANYIAIAAVIMDIIAKLLTIFINLLKACGETPNELGEETKKFIQQAEVQQRSNTSQSYNGFTFNIVEQVLPNDPTVIRKVAQALNTEGIVALESEPSFTQNPKILIEELKLIIDRDNLKAY